jgi:hypothetical protein
VVSPRSRRSDSGAITNAGVSNAGFTLSFSIPITVATSPTNPNARQRIHLA